MGIKSRFANPNKDVNKSFRPFGDRFQINFCVGFFLRFAPGVVDDHLLLVVDFQPVEALVLLELVHSPTELDVLRAPEVPEGSRFPPDPVAQFLLELFVRTEGHRGGCHCKNVLSLQINSDMHHSPG